jgi:hypothetical protein
MTLLRQLTQSQEDEALRDQVCPLVVELLDGRCYEVVSETWSEDESTLSFETDGAIVARFNKTQVLMVRSSDPSEIHPLAA